MKNLFDIATDIRHNKYVLGGLQDISASTIFPVLPISLQQKVDTLLHEVAEENDDLLEQWEGDLDVLDDFITHLNKIHHPYHDDSNVLFVRETSSLITQYVRTSVKHVREALKDIDLSEDYRVLELPKKRKK